MEGLSCTHQPSIRWRAAVAVVSGYLVLGGLASAPARATGAGQATARARQAAPRSPGRLAAVTRWVSNGWARRGIRSQARATLEQAGGAGDVNGATHLEKASQLQQALEGAGASNAAARRQARRIVAGAGRARLPTLKKRLKEAATALGKVPGNEPASDQTQGILAALKDFVEHVVTLGDRSSWGALRWWNRKAAQGTVAGTWEAVDDRLASAIAARDPERIDEALDLATQFREVTNGLASVDARGWLARHLRPKGRIAPLLDAEQTAFSVDRIWGALEATRDGWLKGAYETPLSRGGSTLDALVPGGDLGALAGGVAQEYRSKMEAISSRTEPLTGKPLAEHHWGRRAEKRTEKLVQEAPPRALAAMLRGLLARRTALSREEAQLIGPLMQQAAPFLGMWEWALRRELKSLERGVRELGVQEQEEAAAP